MEARTYFRDRVTDGIDGILVIEWNPADDLYRVTEKRDGSWCAPFLMPAGELRANVHLDGVEMAGKVTDEQLTKVLARAKRNA